MATRENWGSRTGFVLAAIGSAIGLGNIWRFPYITYDNGGGAFLIPYFVALFTAGIPIIILEMAIGHRYKTSPVMAFMKMSKRVTWIGWFQVLVAFVIAMYYTVIVAWSLKFFTLAFTQGWGTNTKEFFYNDFLHTSAGPLSFGGVVPGLAIFAFIAWFLIWLTLFCGVKKGIELIAKIFMPILFVAIIVILIKVVTLEGAGYGLDWLFKPRLDSIFNFSTWLAAYGQIFFSLSICYGIMIAYSSYLPEKSDITNNAIITALMNCGFSILSAILIFSVLGYAATQSGKTIQDVAGAGIGLAFVSIPLAINQMPFSKLVGVIFFFALFVAGFTSIISLVEVCCSTLIDKYKINRKKAVTIFCLIGFAVSFVFTSQAGIFILDIVDHFINAFGIVVGGVLEIIFISWFFKLDSFKQHINKDSDFSVGHIWVFCLKYLMPVILLYMAVGNLVQEIRVPYENYAQAALMTYGWGVVVVVLILSVYLQLSGNKKLNKNENKEIL